MHIIVVLIGLWVVLSCLRYLSTTSKVLLSLLLAGSLYYWYSIAAVFNGGINPEFEEIKFAYTLISANIGGLILGIVLGIIKHKSEGEEQYTARRKKLFLFLLKWGGIYAIYSLVGMKIIDYVTGQEESGWLVMKVWGMYGFAALWLIWFFWKNHRER